MGVNPKFKRRILIIKRAFQLAYIGKILLLEVIAVATTALITSYIFLFVFSDAGMVSAGPWGKGILYSTVAIILVLMVLLFYLGLRISHKIAGPMYRFEQTFQEVQKGNLNSRVILRDGDEMKPMAIAFNAMLDVLKEHVEQRRTGEYHPENIHKKLNDLMSVIGSSEMESAEKEKYREVLEGLKSKLAG